MRWYILRTLLHKELLRHWANSGGILLVVLLMLASLLLSFFGKQSVEGNSVLASAKQCYIDYEKDDGFTKHLWRNIPPELETNIVFRELGTTRRNSQGEVHYQQNSGGIQIYNGDGSEPILLWLWEPGKNALTKYESWFWQEVHKYNTKQNTGLWTSDLEKPKTTQSLLTFRESKRSQIKGGLDAQSGISTALVVFGFFFVCVYLMPSLNCEEREKGILLAQALSPASPREILAARFLFYPVLAIGLATVLATTYRPAVLVSPFFWLAIVASTTGSMGVGLTISSLARSQRAASMGALAYMFVVTLFLFVCNHTGAKALSFLALEYHVPRIFHAVLGDAVTLEHHISLGMLFILAVGWVIVAVKLFRQRGWQT